MGIFFAQVVLYVCAFFVQSYASNRASKAFGRYGLAVAIGAFVYAGVVVLGSVLIGIPISTVGFVVALIAVASFEYFWR